MQTGILMPIFSLPSNEPIGTLGEEAYKFIDFLEKTGNSIWQVLPINPTSYGDSPYQSISLFAGNPYFIDLQMLVEKGLLNKASLKNYLGYTDVVDYNYLFCNKIKILNKCYRNKELFKNEFKSYKRKMAYWLDNYALFETLKKHFSNKSIEFFKGYKNISNKCVENFKVTHALEIDKVKFIQFLFDMEWNELKNYAHSKNISIMGDMPIYAAYDSADVYGFSEEFLLDKELKPLKVAGCPPDSFTQDGQLWGNPLYNYDFMKKNNYSFFMKRFKMADYLFDIVRIDHFRGFSAYYTIPYGSLNAKNGTWEKGPGYSLFRRVNSRFPNLKVLAENLGFLDEAVYKLIDKTGYPGMIIFQFENIDSLKKGFKNNNAIYPGTHDNMTINSFYKESSPEYKKALKEELNISNSLDCIKYCMKQDLKYGIVSFSDYLLLDSEGRINVPSTLGTNWIYRAKKSDFSDVLIDLIKSIRS